ncbi:hypothetical protein NHX12_023780 [Muraenolepis orangiensis]|uniref:Uncharacterized protein n=1 Tax=Muraenolepis orangiensis TaxID=630683 RepID=A0A9Q0ENR9_9TELE|nr:hypothetical protein NHX12_023780 [Muraenolepis orangiensis]
MEALIERLEQAVVRLEYVASKMQTCHCMSNGQTFNGLDGRVGGDRAADSEGLPEDSLHSQAASTGRVGPDTTRHYLTKYSSLVPYSASSTVMKEEDRG